MRTGPDGGATAVLGAWLAFLAGLVVGGAVDGLGSFAAAAPIGGVLAWVGFAAASRCRPSPRHRGDPRMRAALLSLAAGAALGLGNLAANGLIAASDPALRSLLVRHVSGIGPVDALIAAPMVEEVGVRLFLMSALAWLVFRMTNRAGAAFGIALVGSAFVFALLHLGRPMPQDAALATYYRAALVTKYTLAGLPLGWIFWRWGLPYAILGHAAANAVHLALQDRVF